MVKRKYPSLVIFSSINRFTFYSSPTFGSVSSEYPSIVCLYDTECGSFVDTQIFPWFTSEFMLSTSVDHLQLKQFLIKTFHQKSLVFIHIDQAVKRSNLKGSLYRHLDDLRLWLDYLRLQPDNLRLWLDELWLRLDDLRFRPNLLLRLFYLFPQEVIISWI